jgi:exopolysaccharide biosynthesis predicted pyruvyltransferase EpsI
MVLGAECVYRDLDIELVEHGDKADLIAIGGSGGMVEGMGAIPAVLKRCSQQWPDKPLVVLPSTYYYPTRPFAEEIGDRTGPVTLFCREAYSYGHLCHEHSFPDNCQIELDHDMAFHLASSPFVKRFSAMEPRHILIVERTDVEHHQIAMNHKNLKWRKRAGKLLGRRGKKLLYPLVNIIRGQRRTGFRNQCENLLAEHHPDLCGLPRLARDVSNVNANSFEEFEKAIGYAAVVFTTRLHVGILAAMLERPTFIFGGPYHKIKGVFTFSLSSRRHVLYFEPSAE